MRSSDDILAVQAAFTDEHRETFEAMEPASIDVMELNLEDAFIEYTRGPKRSLPAFAPAERGEENAEDKGAA